MISYFFRLVSHLESAAVFQTNHEHRVDPNRLIFVSGNCSCTFASAANRESHTMAAILQVSIPADD